MEKRLDNKELEAALDKIFEFMEKKGIKVDESKKAEFKKQIADDLYKELTVSDIKNVEVQKKLLTCVVSLVMGKEDEYKEMVSNLKSDEKKLTPDPKLENKLTAQLMLLTMLSKLVDHDQKKNIELTPDQFKQKIPKPTPKGKNAKTPEDIEEMDVMSKQIDDTLRNLNAGHNPKVNGGIDFPILGPIIGNLFAFTNQAKPDPNEFSLMVKAITYNTRDMDPMGLENITILNDMAEGIDMDAALTPRLTK